VTSRNIRMTRGPCASVTGAMTVLMLIQISRPLFELICRSKLSIGPLDLFRRADRHLEEHDRSPLASRSPNTSQQRRPTTSPTA
jgi:hypothetical protein